MPARTEPPAASYEFALGTLLGVEGSTDEAVATLDRALALSAKGPDTAYILLEEAQLLAREAQSSQGAANGERLARAAARVADAGRLAPDNLDVLRAVGPIQLALEQSGDASAAAKARAAFEAVVERDPSDVQAAVSLSRIYIQAKELDRAASVLRQLIDKVPQQRLAYALLVEALLRAGRSAEGETAVAELLALDPASIEARLTLAGLQGRRGDVKAATSTLLAAPDAVKGDQRLLRQLAAAVAVLERQASLEPSDATRQENLGDAYAALGHLDQAKEAYRKAGQLDATRMDTLRRKLAALGGESR